MAARVAEAVASATTLFDLPGVEGVGQGATEDGAPAVLVMCAGISDAMRERIPGQVSGLPVVVMDIGERPTAYDASIEPPDVEPDCS